MIPLVLTLFLAVGSLAGQVKQPDCTDPESWPAGMAYVYLKNSGLAGPGTLDFTKTKAIRLASERIGKDLYRQVHLVTFRERTGGTIQVVTVSDASSAECDMSEVEAYVVSKKLGP